METTHGLQYHWLANNLATWETAFARYGNNIAPGLQPQHWPSVFRYFQRRLYVWCMSVFLPDSICTWKTREMCRRPGPESSGYTRAYWKWENDSHLASLVGLADGITSIHAGVFQTCIPSCHSRVPGIWCGKHLSHSAFEKEVFDWACHWWTATPESTHPWGDQPPRFLWPSPLRVSDCIQSNSPHASCCIRHLCTCPWYKWWSTSLRSPPVLWSPRTLKRKHVKKHFIGSFWALCLGW